MRATESPVRPVVLIVEDDDELRAMLVEYLSMAEFRTIDVAAPAPALALAREGTRPDIVLSDLSLPGTSGLEFLRSLRSLVGPEPRFMVMTAFGDWDTYVNAISMGVVEYVTKPFNLQELVQRMRTALAR